MVGPPRQDRRGLDWGEEIHHIISSSFATHSVWIYRASLVEGSPLYAANAQATKPYFNSFLAHMHSNNSTTYCRYHLNLRYKKHFRVDTRVKLIGHLVQSFGKPFQSRVPVTSHGSINEISVIGRGIFCLKLHKSMCCIQNCILFVSGAKRQKWKP